MHLEARGDLARPDALVGERRVLLEPVADEDEDGVGRRGREVLLDCLDVRGLPRLDTVDDDRARFAAKEAERVACGNRISAGRLGGVEALRRVLTDACPE